MEERRIDDPVRRLMEMDSEMVTAADLAPVLHMNPGVIVKYAKDGTWNQERLGKFVISGDRVKFFRKDFLQKCGFMDPDPEEPTDRQLMMRIIQLLMDQNRMLAELLKKPAGAATPTD